METEAISLTEIIIRVGEVIEALGVAVIVIGVVLATFRFVTGLRERGAYARYRRGLGEGLLLGLELLVAGDIIRTVAVTPTLDSVIVLAIIVVIRTFLSWSIELEVSGRWPWQRDEKAISNENL